jgi:hypothetical protein
VIDEIPNHRQHEQSNPQPHRQQPTPKQYPNATHLIARPEAVGLGELALTACED